MTNISTLSAMAQLAQGSYSSFTGVASSSQLIDALTTGPSGFSAAQAERMADHYSVVLQYNDDTAGANGSGTSLSLTVFRDNAGKLTLAIRGTLEPIGDIFPTDANIALRGAGYDQIAALYNWWQRVSHASGQAVAQYRVTEYALSEAPASALLLYSTLNGTSVRSVVLERIADANATGALIPALSADGDGKLDVSGHSLGGHLAMAFAALFPDATASATTFNAPCYSTTSINQQFFATLGAAVPTQANIGDITANVVANHTSAADVSWQGIAMLHSRPGTALDVPIEAQTPPSAEPVKPDALNHSQMVLADALAVYALFDKAQTGLSTTAFNSLLKGATNQEHAGLEGLVGACALSWDLVTPLCRLETTSARRCTRPFFRSPTAQPSNPSPAKSP
ncbi:MAG: hypothetical protein IAE92_12125 [Burkholderiaceae bacterium]|nr:hypothetical protein [Burkholderiaceae bacterium]